MRASADCIDSMTPTHAHATHATRIPLPPDVTVMSGLDGARWPEVRRHLANSCHHCARALARVHVTSTCVRCRICNALWPNSTVTLAMQRRRGGTDVAQPAMHGI